MASRERPSRYPHSSPTRRSSDLLLLAIAAMQPQCGTRSVLAKRFGMDVVIAIDASNSMLAMTTSIRSEEHTSELQSLTTLVCRLLLEKKYDRGPSPASLRPR